MNANMQMVCKNTAWQIHKSLQQLKTLSVAEQQFAEQYVNSLVAIFAGINPPTVINGDFITEVAEPEVEVEVETPEELSTNTSSQEQPSVV